MVKDIGRNEMFYLTIHSTFYLWLYGVGHIVKGHWAGKDTDCLHYMGYSFRLAARGLLYAPSHRQPDNPPYYEQMLQPWDLAPCKPEGADTIPPCFPAPGWMNDVKLTCLKHLRYSLQEVSTTNFVLKMLHSFAPYPFRPPGNKESIPIIRILYDSEKIFLASLGAQYS